MNFADRLNAAIAYRQSPVVVGLDPVLGKLPGFIRAAADTAATTGAAGTPPPGKAAATALLDFSRRVVAAVADVVPAIKIQSAFYEAYGPWGVEAFWEAVQAARAAGLLVIADVKRGDIGSTAEAYADGFLGPAQGSAWGDSTYDVDAITVSPYLGSDGLVPFVDRAQRNGRGVFVLVKTSNPSSGELQDQPLLSGETVSDQVAKLVDYLGEPLVGQCGLSSIGAVVGATYPEELTALRGQMPKAIFLVPGYGAQGGTAQSVVGAFLPDGRGALIAASRSIIFAFDPRTAGPAEMAAGIRSAARTMNADIRQAIASR